MKKKEKEKRKKRRSEEFFIEYQRNMLGLSFTSQPWYLYKLETLVPPYEHLLLIPSSVISIFYFVKYPPPFFSFSSIYRQLS